MTPEFSVVVDIGGTNTRVALCRDGKVFDDTIRRYRNTDNAGIGPVLADYLRGQQVTPAAICIDMAGPVVDGVGTLTNLDWKIDANEIARDTGATRVAVLNDLQAQGFAVAHLGHSSLTPILTGRSAPNDAVRLVVNVGTGLNAVPVHSQGGRTMVPPAEAGHMSLLARNSEELRMIDWIAERHGQPGVEEVLSGRGIERLYAWACHDAGEGTPLPAADVMAAFQTGEPKAQRVMRIFVHLLGRYTGDLALTNLPFGGIFMVGGVIRHLGPHLLSLGFAEAFADKGRFNAYMTQFSVDLVTDDYAPLRGCATHLAELTAG